MKIHRPALKLASGKIVVAARPGLRHKDIGSSGEHGFVTDTGKWVDRLEGAKIAKAAGQVGPEIQRLHSHDLPAYKIRHRKK
jgi:hypothetical protein